MSFDDMLEQKYQILSKTANSEALLRKSQAGLIDSQAATNPAEAAAREAAGYGAGAQGQGAGALSRAQASTEPAEAAGRTAASYGQATQGRGLGGYYSALGLAEPGLAGSEIGLRGAQTSEASANADASRSLNVAAPGSLINQSLGMRGYQTGVGNSNYQPYAKGTSDVPGKAPKTGNTDTQKAMLTPGEAVLNVGAAEHLGRDTIDVLNAIGNIKMMSNGAGVSQGAGPPTKAPIAGEGGIPGYAQGSAQVGSIDPIPGQGGTWEPAPTPPATGGGLRASLNMGVPRPAPPQVPVKGYAEGTSEVPGYADGASEIMAMTHADAARNSKAGEVGNDRKSTVAKGKPKGPDAGEESTKGYAKGTSKVPGKATGKGAGPAKAGGASKVTSEMLQAIMALGKGGGGLIPPGQGQPMPSSMPMPQVAPQQPMR
jgi:hypothetical protein